MPLRRRGFGGSFSTTKQTHFMSDDHKGGPTEDSTEPRDAVARLRRRLEGKEAARQREGDLREEDLWEPMKRSRWVPPGMPLAEHNQKLCRYWNLTEHLPRSVAIYLGGGLTPTETVPQA